MKKLIMLIGVVALLCAFHQEEKKRQRPAEGTMKVGDAAADFELKRLDNDEKVKLSSFKGKSPVVLIFGSYT